MQALSGIKQAAGLLRWYWELDKVIVRFTANKEITVATT